MADLARHVEEKSAQTDIGMRSDHAEQMMWGCAKVCNERAAQHGEKIKDLGAQMQRVEDVLNSRIQDLTRQSQESLAQADIGASLDHVVRLIWDSEKVRLAQKTKYDEKLADLGTHMDRVEEVLNSRLPAFGLRARPHPDGHALRPGAHGGGSAQGVEKGSEDGSENGSESSDEDGSDEATLDETNSEERPRASGSGASRSEGCGAPDAAGESGARARAWANEAPVSVSSRRAVLERALHWVRREPPHRRNRRGR